MVDILFTYQHKAREIEGLCLLKIEMERRGFSSEFLCTFAPVSTSYYFNKPKMIITSALYDNGTLWFFGYRIVGFIKKIVNLQWEQVLSNYDEANPNCYHNPKQFAKDAIHLCWGSAPQMRIINGGVESKNAVITGAIHLDFLSPHFDSYYLNKAELAKNCGLSSEMKWCLFISSFTTHNMTEEEFGSLIDAYGDEILELRRVTIETKKILLSWFQESLEKFPENIIIYRPHPDETSDVELIEMSRRYSNFHIIPDFSVKQWIKVADYIYTWYSTAAAEIARSGKGFGILRPVYLVDDYDISFYKNANYIINKEGFFEDLFKGLQDCPLDIDILKKYYENVEEYPAYKKIADVLEGVLTSDNFDMKNHLNKSYVDIQFFRSRIVALIKKIFVLLFGRFALKLPIVGKSIFNTLVVKERLDRDLSKNKASVDEIDDICKKLRPIVYKISQ